MQFLIIQTAFLGDVILATALAEKLHQKYPDASIDFLVKKGNESTLAGHPFLREVMVLDKQQNKFKNILAVTQQIREKKYDYIINLHRFGSSGLIVWRSGAREKIGFDKNPFSFSYTKKIKHSITDGKHETERNQELIAHLTNDTPARPKLYPSAQDIEIVKQYKQNGYYCIAPASVWFTKQFPKEKWADLIRQLDPTMNLYLIGSENDKSLCEKIIKLSSGRGTSLAGKLSLLQTAALMKDARMNFVNDSAPLHIASAMNASVTAVFCSTVPGFGFGPLSDHSSIIETKEKLACRPCGLHGHATCPEGHFNCALTIDVKEITSSVK